MKRKWLLFISVTVLLLVSSLTLQLKEGKAANLPDIPAQYKEEIDFLVGKGIITGYPNGTFGPDNIVTREVAATMVGRALGLDEKKRPSKFKDVDKDSFGSGYIASAVEKGIITGYTDGTFRPKEPMTRGGMAYLLKRAFELEGNNNTVFSDILSSNSELYAAVDALAANGIANGYTDGTYRPQKPLTRVAFSLLVARGIDKRFRVEANGQLYEKVVSASGLNVRTGPGTSYDSLGVLPNGTHVAVYSEHGDWVYIKSGSYVGYVHRDYLIAPKRRYIAIDAGHGGHDGGALGHNLVEKEINLDVAKKVESILKKKGIDVLMIRSNDTFVELDDRVKKAEKANVNALVSIHTNSHTTESANGTETYYNLKMASSKVNDSKQLATFIQNRLHKGLDTKDRGVKTANFAVLRTTFPSALVELAFISNKADAEKLASQAYQQKAAEAIAAGIIDYYEWKDKN